MTKKCKSCKKTEVVLLFDGFCVTCFRDEAARFNVEGLRTTGLK